MARQTKGRVFRHGTNYWLEYYHGGNRRRVSLGTESKAEAKRKAAEILRPFTAKTEIQRRREAVHALRDAEEAAREASRERIRLAEAWARFCRDPKRPRCGELTLKDYGQRWGKFATWAIARHLNHMDDVGEEEAGEFMASIEDLSPNRFNKILQTCRMVFRTLRQPDPFREVSRRSLTTNSRRALTREELTKICTTATGELRTLLAIGAFTALRLHDAVTLDWSSVSLPHGTISVVPHKTKRTGRAVVIPLHPTLRAILEETPPKQRKGSVTPGLAVLYAKDRTPVCNMVTAHFKACGITTQEREDEDSRAVPKATFHSLRHTFVSMAAEAGIPLGVVQELCGHGSPAIQKYYLHVGKEAAAAAVNSLPALDAPDEDEDDAIPVAAAAVAIDAPDTMDAEVRIAKALAILKARRRLSAADRELLAVLDGER